MAIPYGYIVDGEHRAVDQDAAAVVLRIFDDFTRLYARVSLTEIAAGLNVDGIPTARGGRWYASTVRYVLANPVYAGADGWPPIVSLPMFEAAQRRIDALRPGPPT